MDRKQQREEAQRSIDQMCYHHYLQSATKLNEGDIAASNALTAELSAPGVDIDSPDYTWFFQEYLADDVIWGQME